MKCNPGPKTLEQAADLRRGSLAASCCAGSLSCGTAFDLAAIKKGEVVLDIGCGRGRDVVRAGDRVGRGGRAIGVDRTDVLVAAARAEVPPYLKNVDFIRCELGALELADASIDVVISTCKIHQAADTEAVYREIHRVLRPGGRILVSDLMRAVPTTGAGSDEDATASGCAIGAITEAEYLQAIGRAGFESVEVLERSEPYEKSDSLVRSLTLRGVRPSARPMDGDE